MLLSGLEGKHICTLTVHIAGSAHDTSRKLAHMVLAASKETYIRTAVAERNAERLRISAGDVRIPFARSPDDRQRRRIGIDHKETLLCMDSISKTCQIFYYTIFIDARNKNSGNVSGSKLSQHRTIRRHTVLTWNESKLDAVELRIGLHNLYHLRQKAFRKKDTSLLLCRSHRHHHRLGSGSGAVIHRSIGAVHTGEFRDHGLIFKDIAESTLRHFRLVWSICCKEFRAGDDMRDHGRRIMVICSQTAKAEKIGIEFRQFLEILSDLMLGHCIREVVFFTVDDVLRNIGVEILQGSYSDSAQHLAHIIFRMWEICECHSR